MGKQNAFPIRVTQLATAFLAGVLVIVAGWGAIAFLVYNYGGSSQPNRTSSLVTYSETVVRGPTIIVTSQSVTTTLGPGEIATRLAEEPHVQGRLPPLPTITPSNLLAPIIPGPSFRVDYWLSILVILTGFLLMAILKSRSQ
jgi:hypothetical protein